MADYNLGTAKGIIELEYKGDGAKQARDDLKATGDSADRSTENLKKAGKYSAIAGGVIAAGLGFAVKTATDFEQSMSNVAAASGASGKELDLLSQKALQLGKDTAFSAGESAQAMEELVKAGLTTGDVLNGAADATVALAAAGSIDMPNAAAIAASAMNNFSIQAKDMAHVSDLLAGAANLSATDVQGIGEAFKYVAPMAAATGVSIEDTTTGITALANAGITGSMAGTTLRGMLQNLNPASNAAANEMERLGIITEDGSNRFFDAQGNTRSLAEISGVLAESLNGLSDEQKSSALATIFGARAMTGAIALAGVGEKGFKDLGAAIGEVSAEEVAAKKMDNLAGSIEQLKGSAETLGIVLGTVLVPFIRKIVDAFTGALNTFLNLPGPIQKLAVAFAVIASAGLLVLAMIIKFIQIQKAVQLALAGTRLAFISTWIAALGPVALIIAAIAVVIAIIVLLWKKSETFRDIVKGAWEAVKAAVMAVVDWFKGLPAFFSGVWDGIKSGMASLGEWFSSAWSAIKEIFSSAWAAISGAFSAAWEAIKSAVSAALSFVGSIIQAYFNVYRAIFTAVVGAIKAVWDGFWSLFGGIVTAAWELVKSVITLAWTVIKGVFLLYIGALQAVWGAFWNGLTTVVSAVWNFIKSIISTTLSAISAVVTAYFNVIKAVTSAVWNAVRAVIQAVWSAISGIVRGALSAISSAVSGAWNALKAVTSAAWNAIKAAVKTAVDAAVAIVRGLKDRVVSFFSGAGTWLFNAGKQIIQGLINGITAMIGKVTGAIKSVTGAVARFLPGSPVKEGPLMVLNQGYAGKKIVEMVVDGVLQMQAPMQQAVEAVVSVPSLANAPRGGNDFTKNLALPSPAPVPQAAVPAPRSERDVNVELNVYNPTPEPASESLTQSVQKIAYIGI
jgi:TP901 family phage tail tape measure protein